MRARYCIATGAIHAKKGSNRLNEGDEKCGYVPAEGLDQDIG